MLLPPSMKTTWLFLFLAACAGPTTEDVAEGGAATTAPRSVEEKYGVRPRRYAGYFAASTLAETVFAQAVSEAADFLAPILETRGARLSPLDIAVNVLAEGGALALDSNLLVGLDSFAYFGTDVVGSELPAYRPYLPPAVLAHLDAGYAVASVNERRQPVRHAGRISLRQGVLTNAGMLALARVRLQEAARHLDTRSWPPEAWFFWTTVFYNLQHEPAEARQMLRKDPTLFRKRWTGPDDPVRFSQYAHYNAAWRTATWELTRAAFPDGPKVLAPEAPRSVVVPALESRHPYALDALGDEAKRVTAFSGARVTRVRFEKIETAPGASLVVSIVDRSGALVPVEVLDGAVGSYVTAWLPTASVWVALTKYRNVPTGKSATPAFGYRVASVEYAP